MQERLGIKDMILPIDHLATRVYSQNREAALLEDLALSSYYYWGSYDIKHQNSSTNVTRNVRLQAESVSPAKMLTAGNQPYCVNHLDKLPSPTETFVRNYGPRLHHIALAVKDGQRNGRSTSILWWMRLPRRVKASCSTSSARAKKASSRYSRQRRISIRRLRGLFHSR